MYDYIIVGGGPSAAIEAHRLAMNNASVLMIYKQPGGTMSMMGSRRLQSYCHELELPDSAIGLDNFMSQLTFSPTADEYITYVSHYIDNQPVERIIGDVVFITHDDNVFICKVSNRQGVDGYRATHLVLATGIQPKRISEALYQFNTITCFDAYKLLIKGNPALREYKQAIIIGGGNSAFQLAESAAAAGLNTTILAKNYLGVFPQETNDRYALRAPTQSVIERIWKSQTDPLITPLNFFIYTSLAFYNDELVVNLLECENACHIANLSINNASYISSCDNTSRQNNTEKQLCISTAETLFISAIGTEGCIPENDIPSLKLNHEGFVDNVKGKTGLSGLYVCGTLAGARSVNDMQITEY
ncbi:hypothetical protein CWC46_15150 [Prodigiosinella confusarubida]|uniref:FAD/NAD(P)-binding domain-containing protein n=1 Tax=Serratia sp. (strain ATCC 39006) TaxID=104623 RepID=A0A2I5T949_SERS3|nr:FAD-dependent oxidoreductase [Serratia sp. ATCC 39006]AUH01032.1 hypothetical protein CWC46_15150 [Serratia sp. ATCC 39006]AUH05353.1 hypothetical protein Ser39006_015155 [Serratia sp. ATCC 39006]